MATMTTARANGQRRHHRPNRWRPRKKSGRTPKIHPTNRPAKDTKDKGATKFSKQDPRLFLFDASQGPPSPVNRVARSGWGGRSFNDGDIHHRRTQSGRHTSPFLQGGPPSPLGRRNPPPAGWTTCGQPALPPGVFEHAGDDFDITELIRRRSRHRESLRLANATRDSQTNGAGITSTPGLPPSTSVQPGGNKHVHAVTPAMKQFALEKVNQILEATEREVRTQKDLNDSLREDLAVLVKALSNLKREFRETEMRAHELERRRRERRPDPPLHTRPGDTTLESRRLEYPWRNTGAREADNNSLRVRFEDDC